MLGFAILLAYTLGSGAQQGVLHFVLREFVPEKYSQVLHYALHYLGVALYLLLAALVSCNASLAPPTWHPWAVAGLIRLACFDPALNLAHNYLNRQEGRAPEPVFAVGTKSTTDRAVRWLAALLRQEPTRVSFGVRLLAVAALLYMAA